MEPIPEHIESFTVTGFSTRTCNPDEMTTLSAKIPSLWQQFYSSELVDCTPSFGVYSDYQSDENGFYKLTVGTAQNTLLAKTEQVKINSGDYLVFKNKGPMPEVVVEIWKQIWDFFDSHDSYQRNFVSDFEKYISDDEVAVYIGISKK